MRAALYHKRLRIDLPALRFVVVIVMAGSTLSLAQSRFSLTQTYCTGSSPCVLTYHNDGNRDGVNSSEATLKASTLNSTTHPTPQWMVTTDGLIYGQPLYIHQLQISGTYYNMVYVVTENNTVLALNANSGATLASVNLNNTAGLSSGSAEIAIPLSDLPGNRNGTFNCLNLVPEVGITGTPVIDVSITPPVIYLVTAHEDVDSHGNKTFRQKLHGLYADTLQEIPASPLILDAAFATAHAPGFDPLNNLQRAGLALVPTPHTPESETSTVWVSWSSQCDEKPYFGFEIAFEYSYPGSPIFTNIYEVLNTESECMTLDLYPCQGGVWMGGAAPAFDASRNIYLSTGNGNDADQGTGDYSNSILRVTEMGLQDFYSPPDYHWLNIGGTVACTNPSPPSCPSLCTQTGAYCQRSVLNDWDLGAGGIVLLSPVGFSLTYPELVSGGKQGMLYTVFSGSSNMGQVDQNGFSPNSQEYACTTATTPTTGAVAQCFFSLAGGIHGSPAFLGGAGSQVANQMYVAAIHDTVKAFQLNSTGLFTTTPATPTSGHVFQFPRAVPSVTWNSSGSISDAIVWALDTNPYGQDYNSSSPAAAGPAGLYAYAAVPSGTSLGSELWDTSAYNSTNPGNPGAVKFVVPTIADGMIFIAGGSQNYYPDNPGGNCLAPAPGTSNPTGCGAVTMYK